MKTSTGKIKTGIVGAGQPNIATNHQLPAALRTNLLEVVALCDMNPGVFEYSEKYGVKGFSDYAQMLADPEISMVQIATPDWCHCEQAVTALRLDRHVLLQKPPCLNNDELNSLITAAKSSAGSLKVLLNCRETRLCRTITRYLQEGAIGQLREIMINYRGRRFPIDNPASRYLKYECGGVWLHNSLHWLDEAFCYSGSLPGSVQVFAAKNSNGKSCFLGDGPNYWSAIFPMGNNVTFNFEYNTMLLRDGLPGGIQRTLIGTEGEIRQLYGSSELMLYRFGREPESLVTVDAELSPEEDVIESFRLAMDAYAEQIIFRKERAPRINDSLSLMNALLKGIESWNSEESINLEDFNASL
jgi:predicted dehydrogenase